MIGATPHKSLEIAGKTGKTESDERSVEWSAKSHSGRSGGISDICRRAKGSDAPIRCCMAGQAVPVTSNSPSATMGFGALGRKSGSGFAIAKPPAARCAPIARSIPKNRFLTKNVKSWNGYAKSGVEMAGSVIAAAPLVSKAAPCPLPVQAVLRVRPPKRGGTSIPATAMWGSAGSTAHPATRADAIAAVVPAANTSRRIG